MEAVEGKAGLRRLKPVRLSAHSKAYVLHTAKSNLTSYKDRAVLDDFLASVGDRPLDEVSPFHVERWKQERASDVSKSTVNRELNIIRGCFSRAVDWGRLALSPLRTVKPYKVDDQRIRVLNDDEIKLVLSTSADVALICRVTLVSLNRISEVLGLRREHIGPSWMEIRRKEGRVHRVALPDDLRALLARCHVKSGYVFGEGKDGEPRTQQTASTRVIRALAALSLTDVTCVSSFKRCCITLPSAWSWAMRGVRRVLLGVLVGGVGGDLGGDVVADPLGDAVGVGEERAEVLVEGLEDVAQAVELGLALAASRVRRHGLDLRVLVRQGDLQRRLLLDAVAVHVDGFEDALGEVLLPRCRQLGYQQVQQNGQLLPLCVAVRNHRGEEGARGVTRGRCRCCL